MTRRIVILGAAGRDFHDFNVALRDDASVHVVAFTAAQIPGIDRRRYPPALAGPRYPDGIPILPEADLETLVRNERIDEVIFAYSDASHADVMHLASRALAAGADFSLLGPSRTMLRADLPVLAITAVRTGCGKSQVARWAAAVLSRHGLRVGILRHPMPYGDLERQRAQRFLTLADLEAADCTVEEREEYEPHLAAGHAVFAGVDYGEVLRLAQAQADVLLWDGGNNDFPFLRPDRHLVVVDALRPSQVATHHPGETNVRMADAVILNKVNAASGEQIRQATGNIRSIRPGVPVFAGQSIVDLDEPERVRGKRVVVVEDGPTLTHGGMPTGAGYAAALAAGAAEIVDPRRTASPELREVFARYPHIGPVLPAVGYGPAQCRALAESLDRSDADAIVSGTPADLARLLNPVLPVVRARYEFAPAPSSGLQDWLDGFARGVAAP